MNETTNGIVNLLLLAIIIPASAVVAGAFIGLIAATAWRVFQWIS